MKIDYVVPMVFTDDPEWQSAYSRSGLPSLWNDIYAVRYRSWDTEELLIRCIMKFMPWIGKIHVLLSGRGQYRGWMTKYEKVYPVYHEDFIPKKHLPVFNSCTIEMFLPFIPNLSEHFIYANDDMFPMSPLEPTDFFDGGLPCQVLNEKPFPIVPNIFQTKCMNQQNMVGSVFGRSFTNTWLRNGHSLAPMLLSEGRKVRERFWNEIERGISNYRSEYSYNQYIYVLWQQFSGKYHQSAPKRTYLSVRKSVEFVERALGEKNLGIVCMNDHECCSDITPYADVLRKALKRILKQ